MEFWSGHDLNNDGKNDVFIRHELKPSGPNGDPDVRMAVIIGAVSAPFIFLIVNAPELIIPLLGLFGILGLMGLAVYVVWKTAPILWKRYIGEAPGDCLHCKTGRIRNDNVCGSCGFSPSADCPICKSGKIGKRNICSYCRLSPSDKERSAATKRTDESLVTVKCPYCKNGEIGKRNICRVCGFSPING